MVDKNKTLNSVMRLWTPEPQTSKTSFDLSPVLWSRKSPVFQKQKSMIHKFSESPLKHASTLKNFFEKEIEEISEFLHFNTSEKFTKDYPISKVLYINNFSKNEKSNLKMVTQKFIFNIRQKKNKFTSENRLKDELKDLLIKETYKPILKKIQEIKKTEEKKREKINQINFQKVYSTDFFEKIKKMGGPIIKNIKFKGKNVFPTNRLKSQKLESVNNKNENVVNIKKSRPYSASYCLESAGRQYNFVNSLLSKKTFQLSSDAGNL